MGEPFSILTGVAGLISLGIQVTQSLIKFYSLYKHQDSEIASTTESLESVSSILQSLDFIPWILRARLRPSILEAESIIGVRETPLG